LEGKVRFCCSHFEKYDTEAFGIFFEEKEKSEILLFLDPSPCPPAGALIYIY